jgi:hypothetical protein
MALWGASSMIASTSAHADAVAYLVNVTVRPGYNFAGPDAALDYGRGAPAGVVEVGNGVGGWA